MEANCSSLNQLTNLESYISILRNVTDDALTFDVMRPCRQDICAALYGTGSSDVSGIGVIVGYFVEFSLAAILAVMLLVLNKPGTAQLLESCRRITAAYVDSTAALALSVELACAIMLIRKNFGLGAYEFGGLTVQIAWIVATLVMLPVVTFCWRDLKDKKSEVRLCTTALAFVLFLITFICRMISTYSGRQIGSSTDAVISDQESKQIALLCFEKVSILSPSASNVVEVFSIGSPLWTSCNIVLALMEQCIDDTDQGLFARTLRRCTKSLQSDATGTTISIAALVFWSVPLFWALMTLRSSQKVFAASIDETSGSDVWSFGQIIAVIVFLPVLNELLHQYLGYNKPSNGDYEQHPELAHVVAQSPKLGEY